jgi:hypothetical protein
LLITAILVLLLFQSERSRRANSQPATVSRISPPLEKNNPRAVDTNSWIRFTFTAVEVRHDGDKRWLAFDYVEHIHGECKHAFRNVSKVPGFTGQTVASSFLAKEDDSPGVLHHRISFLLPPSVTDVAAHQLRDNLSGMVAKSVKVYAGDETSLFNWQVNGGSIAGSVGVIPSFP